MKTKEVAIRALCLFSIWLINTPTPREGVLLWIKNNELWNELSPEELKFVQTEVPTQQQKIDFSWHIERLYVLAWVLGEVDEMVPADQQGTIAEFEKAISPLNAYSSERYLKNVKRRNEIEIWDMAGQIERLHWEARNERVTGVKSKEAVDLEIIQERHHAINWILWGNDEAWDDVFTDT